MASLPGNLGDLEQAESHIRLQVQHSDDGKRYSFKFFAWNTVHDVKLRNTKETGIKVARQRLFYRGRELRNHYTLELLAGSVLLLYLRAETWHESIMVEPYGVERLSFPKRLKGALDECRRAMRVHHFKPKLALDGSGGTYFLPDTRQRFVAALKPADEEPFAENNPRGMVGQRAEGACGQQRGTVSQYQRT